MLHVVFKTGVSMMSSWTPPLDSCGTPGWSRCLTRIPNAACAGEGGGTLACMCRRLTFLSSVLVSGGTRRGVSITANDTCVYLWLVVGAETPPPPEPNCLSAPDWLIENIL